MFFNIKKSAQLIFQLKTALLYQHQFSSVLLQKNISSQIYQKLSKNYQFFPKIFLKVQQIIQVVTTIMIPLQYKRKKPDEGKESLVQATTDAESISICESFIYRKRGFTLCKHHCIEFDRMYRQKDLIVQPYSSKMIESNAHGTEKQPLSNNLNFGNKIALKSVKSDKKLQMFRGQTSSAPCRVSIGSSSKKTRFEDQMVSYNESTYGKSKKVKGKEIKFAENCFEYGLGRKN